MKKFYIILILSIFLSGLFFGGAQKIYASGLPGFPPSNPFDPNALTVPPSVFISYITPLIAQEGQTINGTLSIEASCFHETLSYWPKISFEGSVVTLPGSLQYETLDGSCWCDSNSEDTERKRVRCDFPFKHTYDTAGDWTIVPAVSGGAGFSTASTYGEAKTITVIEAPTPAVGGGNDLNPLIAASTAELVTTVTNVIFYILSGLAVGLIMFGGITIITAVGSPTQLTKGKKIIIFTIIGYALILIARGIIALVFQIFSVSITTT